MIYRKRASASATFQKDPELFFIGRAETIDELWKRLVIASHFKVLDCQGLLCFSSSISLDHNLKRILLEASNVDQAFLAIDHGFATITRDMITSDLDLAINSSSKSSNIKASSKSSWHVVSR